MGISPSVGRAWRVWHGGKIRSSGFAVTAECFRLEPYLGHDGGGLLFRHGLAGGCRGRGNGGKLFCLLLTSHGLHNAQNIARRRSRAGAVAVPLAQRPNHLLTGPVLQFVAPPCQLRRSDFWGLVRLEIGAQNGLDLKSNRLSVIVQPLRRKRFRHFRRGGWILHPMRYFFAQSTIPL